MVSIFQEKKEGRVPTVVLNLTQKISDSSCPSRLSLPPERSLRSAHRLSAELPSKTNTCGRTGSSAPTFPAGSAIESIGGGDGPPAQSAAKMPPHGRMVTGRCLFLIQKLPLRPEPPPPEQAELPPPPLSDDSCSIFVRVSVVCVYWSRLAVRFRLPAT